MQIWRSPVRCPAASTDLGVQPTCPGSTRAARAVRRAAGSLAVAVGRRRATRGARRATTPAARRAAGASAAGPRRRAGDGRHQPGPGARAWAPGLLMAHGASRLNRRAARRSGAAAPIDTAPTILQALGVPISRELAGGRCVELFTADFADASVAIRAGEHLRPRRDGTRRARGPAAGSGDDRPAAESGVCQEAVADCGQQLGWQLGVNGSVGSLRQGSVWSLASTHSLGSWSSVRSLPRTLKLSTGPRTWIRNPDRAATRTSSSTKKPPRRSIAAAAARS